MLTTGVVTESALIFRDLFFIDGTDVTVISRLAQPQLIQAMLTQLPVKTETRAYAHFSDAFIRRHVGPRMKIAQLRRMQARAVMEYLTSCALLARLDGLDGVTSIEELVGRGYVAEGSLLEDCTESCGWSRPPSTPRVCACPRRVPAATAGPPRRRGRCGERRDHQRPRPPVPTPNQRLRHAGRCRCQTRQALRFRSRASGRRPMALGEGPARKLDVRVRAQPSAAFVQGR